MTIKEFFVESGKIILETFKDYFHPVVWVYHKTMCWCGRHDTDHFQELKNVMYNMEKTGVTKPENLCKHCGSNYYRRQDGPN